MKRGAARQILWVDSHRRHIDSGFLHVLGRGTLGQLYADLVQVVAHFAAWLRFQGIARLHEVELPRRGARPHVPISRVREIHIVLIHHFSLFNFPSQQIYKF